MHVSSEHVSRLLAGLRAAVRAGDEVLKVYQTTFSVEYKDDRSPLTLADKTSHSVITDLLGEIPVLSEEGGDVPFETRLQWEEFWLVDPLDGTREFVKRNGEFTVNIALIRRGVPEIGIIYAPVKAMMYFGCSGLGSYRIPITPLEEAFGQGLSQGQLIREITSRSVRLAPVADRAAPLTITGSRSHSSPKFEEFVGRVRAAHGDVEFVSAGSSLKFCLVAEGTADIYPRLGTTMEWDTAAGQCIVHESGGTVVSAETGTSLVYNKPDLRNPFFICSGKRCS